MKRKIWIFLLTIMCIIMLIPIGYGLVSFYTIFKIDYEQTGYFWSEDTAFDLDLHAVKIETDDQFSILFLTDTHYIGIFDETTSFYITSLVEKTQPDLIILVGDNTFTPINGDALSILIGVMDSFKIPWTLVFGNHDDFGRHTKNYMSYMLMQSVYGIFQFGPNDFGGSGNQVIHLVSNGHHMHTLILLDTVQNGVLSPPITHQQIAWYEWAIKGLEDIYGEPIETSVVTHVPIPEMTDALTSGTILMGTQQEAVSLMENNGLYEKIKTLNSTKYLFFGHDHLNDTVTLYESIYFTYVSQVGYLTYGRSQKGGTLFKLKKHEIALFEIIYM